MNLRFYFSLLGVAGLATCSGPSLNDKMVGKRGRFWDLKQVESDKKKENIPPQGIFFSNNNTCYAYRDSQGVRIPYTQDLYDIKSPKGIKANTRHWSISTDSILKIDAVKGKILFISHDTMEIFDFRTGIKSTFVVGRDD